jgi:hypothetical protein
MPATAISAATLVLRFRSEVGSVLHEASPTANCDDGALHNHAHGTHQLPETAHMSFALCLILQGRCARFWSAQMPPGLVSDPAMYETAHFEPTGAYSRTDDDASSSALQAQPLRRTATTLRCCRACHRARVDIEPGCPAWRARSTGLLQLGCRLSVLLQHRELRVAKQRPSRTFSLLALESTVSCVACECSMLGASAHPFECKHACMRAQL